MKMICLFVRRRVVFVLHRGATSGCQVEHFFPAVSLQTAFHGMVPLVVES
jgi:hypothetical protein